jgi:tetratricopeptide (TPR) repeat protein
LALVTSDDLAATLLYEQLVTGARPDVTVLVRQQLDDAPEVAARIARAGNTVDARADLRALVAQGALWEPGPDAPPWPPSQLVLGVPSVHPIHTPAPAPSAAALQARLDALLDDPSLTGRRAATLVALGRLALARTDEPSATALFDAARRARPGDGAATVNLAVLTARRGDFRGAAELLEPVIAREPERVVARINLGRYRLQLGELDAAEHAFRAARARAPRDPQPLSGLARVALGRGHVDEARTAIALALRYAPNDPEARELYGKIPRSE